MTLHLKPTQSDKAFQRRIHGPHQDVIAEIAREVAKEHREKYQNGVCLADLKSRFRYRYIVKARQEAFWRINEERPDISLPEIGRYFNRDHTTVVHGIRSHKKRMEKEHG